VTGVAASEAAACRQRQRPRVAGGGADLRQIDGGHQQLMARGRTVRPAALRLRPDAGPLETRAASAGRPVAASTRPHPPVDHDLHVSVAVARRFLGEQRRIQTVGFEQRASAVAGAAE
jgi:hypothetical protein